MHPLTVEDLYNSNVRVKVEEFPEYMFCVFYGIRKDFSMVEIDFIIGKDFLITNHKKELVSFEKLKSEPEKIERLMKKGLDFLFHYLIDGEIDNFVPILENIDDQIENIEEEVTEKPKPELLAKILEIKRTIIKIKKITLPQREKISYVSKSDLDFITKKAVPYFRDVYDHAIRVSDMIDNYREATGNAFDVYMSAVSNNMNEVMKVLSVIATIALPLTVVSGVYGTNFSILPGAGFTYGFWTMIIVMILMMSGMLFYFRRKGWF